MGIELSKMIERQLLNPELPYMPKQEWESRIREARQLMVKMNLDAMMTLNNDGRLYFFGSQKPYRSAYPFAGIIPREGPATLIATGEDLLLMTKEQGHADRSRVKLLRRIRQNG